MKPFTPPTGRPRREPPRPIGPAIWAAAIILVIVALAFTLGRLS